MNGANLLGNFSHAGVPATEDCGTMTHVCMITAVRRSQPKPLPVFPNPAPRPEGSLPLLLLDFLSAIPDLRLHQRLFRCHRAAFLRCPGVPNRPIKAEQSDYDGN
jgi:hypothetical protein